VHEDEDLPESVLVVGIAPTVNGLATELEQPPVELLAHEVELLVGRVAQAQHGKTQLLQRRRRQLPPKQEPPACLRFGSEQMVGSVRLVL
jgi:hypothetical protein